MESQSVALAATNDTSPDLGQALVVVIGMMLLLSLTLASYFKILLREQSVAAAFRRSIQEIADAKSDNAQLFAQLKNGSRLDEETLLEPLTTAFPPISRIRSQADQTLPALLVSTRTINGHAFRAPDWHSLQESSSSINCGGAKISGSESDGVARAISIRSCTNHLVTLTSNTTIVGNFLDSDIRVPSASSRERQISTGPLVLTILGDAHVNSLELPTGGVTLEILVTGQLVIETLHSQLTSPSAVLLYAATGDIRVGASNLTADSILCERTSAGDSPDPLALTLLAPRKITFLGRETAATQALGCDYSFSALHWTNYAVLGEELWPLN